MSEPTRWKVEELNCCFDADMVESSAGEYVLYSDYASLKEEVDALKLGSLLTAVDVLQFIKLKEENERLRKAIQKFQAVAPNASNPCGCGFWTCETKDLLELNDALEGKQS